MRYKFSGTFRDGAGNIVAGGTVSVYDSGTTTPASIYETATGATVVNSTTTASDGTFTFYILEGDYYGDHTRKISLSKSGYTTKEYDYVEPVDFYNGAFTKATIDAALTAIGTSTRVTLLLRPGTWVIDSNADWSAYTNVTFKIAPGALISHGAYTVKLPNPDAGYYQILDGTGLVTFYGNMDKIKCAWFGAKGDGVNDDGAAINKSIASANYSTCKLVKLHAGTFLSSVEISFYSGSTDFGGIVLEGVGESYGYGASIPSTTIKFTAALASGVNLIRTTISGIALCRLQYFTVNGNGYVNYGINVASANILSNVSSTGCLLAGIRLGDYTNSTHLEYVTGSGNTGAGLLVEGAASTVYSVNKSNFRINLGRGIDIQGGGGSFRDIVSESNNLEGLRIYTPSGSIKPSADFDHLYLENNGLNDGANDLFQVEINSYDPAHLTNVPTKIHFAYGTFKAGAVTQKYVNAPAARDVDFHKCGFAGSSVAIASAFVLTSYSTNFTATFEDVTYDADLTAAFANGNRCVQYYQKTSGNSGIMSTGSYQAANLIAGKTKLTTGGATSVSTAATIYTLTSSANYGVVEVAGQEGANIFIDKVAFYSGSTPAVISSTTLNGSPQVRTYTTTTTALKLAMAANTYAILVAPMEITT